MIYCVIDVTRWRKNVFINVLNVKNVTKLKSVKRDKKNPSTNPKQWRHCVGD